MTLLEKANLGSLELNNRLVFPPMATGKSDPIKGLITDDIISYYNEKTKLNRFGLVITEHSFVMREGRASISQMGVDCDNCVKGLKKLTGAIHKNGCKVIMQLNHAGANTKPEITGQPTVGPSLAVSEGLKAPDRELSVNEINNIVNAFAQAALRAKDAGFDGVEIHAAHRYLFNQFYSPLTNKRVDEYGGSVENRVRVITQTVEAVKKLVGNDFTILVRLGAMDYVEGGNTEEDAVKACQILEACGVNALDISGGMSGYMVKGLTNQEGYFKDITKLIKQNVKIPVIMAGGIVTLRGAQALIDGNYIDFPAVGRAVYGDSMWFKKQTGR